MIYEIHKYPTGELLDYQKDLAYIRLNPDSGAYITADKYNYEGIAVKDNPYNILEHEGLKGVETVFLREADEGRLLDDLMAENNQLNMKINELKQQQLDTTEMVVNMQYENDLAKEAAV